MGKWSYRSSPFRGAFLIAFLIVLSAPPDPPSRAGPARIVLEWHVPLPQTQRGSDGALTLSIPGYRVDERPGAPSLPYTSTLLALPPMANPILRVTRLETVTLSPPDHPDIRSLLSHPSEMDVPGPHPDPLEGSEPVFLREIGTMRGIRLALMVFRPIWLSGDHLEMARHVRVEIEMDAPLHDSPTLDALQRQIARHVLNPAQAIPDSPDRFHLGQNLSVLSINSPIAFIEADRPGIYRLRYEDLSAIGMGNVDPSSIRLFRGSDEAAYAWEGDDDPNFEPGEAILFYAEPRPSRWVNGDVYRLTAGAGSGMRMPSRSAISGSWPLGTIWSRALVEENRLYMPDRFTPNLPVARDGDRWVWNAQTGPAEAATAYPFSLSGIRLDRPPTLTLWLIGYTASDHRWEVRLNNTWIGEAQWSGKSAITATLSIPSNLLQEGSNTLSLRPLTMEGGWLDAFEIRYARAASPITDFTVLEGEGTPHRYELPVSGSDPYVLDITNPLVPIQLTGASTSGAIAFTDPPDGGGRRYAIAPASAIRSPVRIRRAEPLFLDPASPSGGDLVILTHPDFVQALGPLRDLRRSQGMQVAVVNVLGIYDAYGDGRMDPEAIRRFIRDIYNQWNPRPTHVLLFGDGSFDPKRYRSSSPLTYIPPYLADVDPKGGETAADNRYVAVDGEDNLPDLIIGRIPAKTPGEAAGAVEKIVAYESHPFPGGWNARVVLVADDADEAGDFPNISETSAALVTSPYVPVRLYCAGSSPRISDCSEEEAASIRRRLRSEWNYGALLLQFAGHSSWHQWALERFFHIDDLPALGNERRLPVVLGMTCFTGAFHRPEPTLDEALMLHPNGGAIATWGSTGLGISQGHDQLSRGFFESVFVDQDPTIGEATMAGKLKVLQSAQHLDLLDTFTLLGDPATRIDRAILPWASNIYLPLVLR